MMRKIVILLSVTICCLSVSTYDATLGLNLCKLTVASYCKPAKIRDWSCQPCINSPIKLQHAMLFYNLTGDVLGYIGTSTSPNAIILIFRGTKIVQIKNWIQDIDFIKMNFPTCNNGCQVHRGFYLDFLQISLQVTSAVKQYTTRFGITDIMIAGHSLGGALATHAAIHLVSKGYNVEALYTYGSPRVGDNKFSIWFDSYVKTSNKVRITHGRDPVPHLPPHFFEFNHVPHQVFYKGYMRQGYITCNDNGYRQDPYCSNRYIADVMVNEHLDYFDIDFSGTALLCQ